MATTQQSLAAGSVLPPVPGAFNVGSIWARALIPSFSDCFFIFLFVWLFLAGSHGWENLLGDGDIGWHIRTGEWIMAHHAAPTHDLYSFTKPGAPWFAWEWLADIIYALLFRAASFKGIVFLSGILIGLYSTVVLRHAFWRGANAMIALPLTLLGVGSSTVHFLARPHVFTLMLLACSMWLIDRDRRQQTPWLWLLIPTTVLWVNLHGGFFMFLACLGIVTAGSACEAWLHGDSERGLRWAASRRYAVLFAACAAASLVNPYGFELHRHIGQYLRSDWIQNNVQEFLAPTFRNEGQRQFEALLILCLLVVVPLLRKRRIADALLIVFLAHSSLTSLRHAPLFCLVTVPIAAEEFSAMWSAAVARLPRKSTAAMLFALGADVAHQFRRSSVWIPAALFLIAIAPGYWPSDFPKALFPTDVVSRHAQLFQQGRVLTTDQWGDYLIFRFYPRQTVYVDGRSDFYGEELGNEYLHVLQLAPNWEKTMSRRDFNVALLPPNWPLTQMLKCRSEWHIAEDTGTAVLFVRGALEAVPVGQDGSPKHALVLQKTRRQANENLQPRRSLYTGDSRNERG